MMSLPRQLHLVFDELEDELLSLSSGIIFVYIRNNGIGKFGIKHDPIQARSGQLQPAGSCLKPVHIESFRRMAIASLQHKKHWTHGEIQFEFALQGDTLVSSVQFESNYNMANLIPGK